MEPCVPGAFPQLWISQSRQRIHEVAAPCQCSLIPPASKGKIGIRLPLCGAAPVHLTPKPWPSAPSCAAEEACEANARLARWHHHSGGAHPRVECCPAGSCDGVRISAFFLKPFLVLVYWTTPEASAQGTRMAIHMNILSWKHAV